MEDNIKRVGGPAANPKTSDEWGDPPMWSPWNFQFPNASRAWHKHVYGEAHGSGAAREEANSVKPLRSRPDR
jgi:hypothetical protein